MSIYPRIRHLALKPGRADQISLLYGEDGDQAHFEPSATSSLEKTTTDQTGGSQTWAEFLRELFPVIFKLWDRLQQSRSVSLPVDLNEDMEAELINRSSYHYSRLLRESQRFSPEDRPTQRALRMQAIRSAFGDYSLDPDHGRLDDEWVDDVASPYGNSNASTSTPDPQDLFSDEDLLILVSNEPLVNPEGGDDFEPIRAAADLVNAVEPAVTTNDAASVVAAGAIEPSSEPATLAFEPTVPLGTLLERRPLDIPQTPQPRPATPVPGILRAPSLPQVTPRPVRRPTDLGDDSRLRPTREEYVRHRRLVSDGDDSQYRVTTLSTHPAANLALGITSLITPILMLPLDMMFLRSLTRHFLISRLDDIGVAGRDPALADIWPLSPRMTWNDIGTLSSPGFWGKWFLTLGIQGVISLITWTASAHFTLHLSRQFGWGQF